MRVFLVLLLLLQFTLFLASFPLQAPFHLLFSLTRVFLIIRTFFLFTVLVLSLGRFRGLLNFFFFVILFSIIFKRRVDFKLTFILFLFVIASLLILRLHTRGAVICLIKQLLSDLIQQFSLLSIEIPTSFDFFIEVHCPLHIRLQLGHALES